MKVPTIYIYCLRFCADTKVVVVVESRIENNTL